MLITKGQSAGLLLDSRTFQDPNLSSKKMRMEYEGRDRWSHGTDAARRPLGGIRFAHTVGGNIAYSNVSFLPSLYVFIWKMGTLVSSSQQISEMI